MNFTGKRSTAEPRNDRPDLDGAQLATFAAGCFWGVEASFREIEGVLDTRVGYTGGRSLIRATSRSAPARLATPRPCEVSFDPELTSYDELLETFWSIHNPTSRNRQGWDFGSQYRSAIFFHDAEQERQAIASRDRAPGRPPAADRDRDRRRRRRSTEAEEYHQRYFEQSGGAVCATTLRR